MIDTPLAEPVELRRAPTTPVIAPPPGRLAEIYGALVLGTQTIICAYLFVGVFNWAMCPTQIH